MSEIVVQLENVNIYQSGNLILQAVNFEVQKGEFVYLVGKTGTEKRIFNVFTRLFFNSCNLQIRKSSFDKKR